MPVLKIQTDPENVLVKFDGVIAIHRGSCCVKTAAISMIAGHVPQIHKQIFSFERPMLGEGHFNPGAHGPAEFWIILEWQAGQGSFYIRASAAGGTVETRTRSHA